MPYTLDKQVAGGFDEIVDQTTEALADEGFGVLADIDVKQTFDEKLDLEEPYRQYRILGACNPEFAHDALDAEPHLGALLPCNVIVYETVDGTVGVSAVDPEELIGVVDNDALDGIASEVRDRFERVLATLPEAAAA